MIYTCYFQSLGNSHLNISVFGTDSRIIDLPKLLADELKRTYHQYVFIITPEQQAVWDDVEEKYWKPYVHYKMPYFVHNVNYPDQERRLKVMVLKGTGNEA